MQWFKNLFTKPVVLTKEEQVIEKLLPGGEITSSISLGYQQVIKITLGANIYLKFSYSGIRKKMDGSLDLWVEGKLAIMTYPREDQYWRVMEMIEAHFDVNSLCQKFQSDYTQKIKLEKEFLDSTLDKLIKD